MQELACSNWLGCNEARTAAKSLSRGALLEIARALCCALFGSPDWNCPLCWLRLAERLGGPITPKLLANRVQVHHPLASFSFLADR
ncbi:hypothetical protein BHE90_001667 [Fusarium euwallaceae]|uniref:Uncharacterized protein n=1 Tax=Fusarium euwallaceae TaxID=1147111 RepID=A0A430M772_9HYPO|nr:hypothetical protein BHE90_001667 [Fusarium euwallaceae]